MKLIFNYLILLILLLTVSQIIAAQTPVWTEVAPGVWKTVIGKTDMLDLYKAADIKPSIDRITGIPSKC
jgi:hypothetical protein